MFLKKRVAINLATQIIFFCCKIRGKQYSSSDSGQSVAKIPTLEEISRQCAGYARDFVAFTSNKDPLYSYPVIFNWFASYNSATHKGYVIYSGMDQNYIPYISIIL